MTEAGPAATFSTTAELAEHLADRARGSAPMAASSRSLVDILSPLYQRTDDIASSLRSGDGRYSGTTAHDALDILLDRCETDARQAGKPDSDIDDAVLASVAWIDETISSALSAAVLDTDADATEDPFADPDVPEPESQELYRLQTTRFEISDAGVRFFDKLSELTSEQDEVREVYVAVLQLGFRGQYFAEDDRRQLDGIKQEHAERLLSVTRRPVEAEAAPPTPAPAVPAAQAGGRTRWMMIAAATAVVALVAGVFAFDWYGDRNECLAMYGDDCDACKANPEFCFYKQPVRGEE